MLNYEAGAALFPTDATVTDEMLVRIWSDRELKNSWAGQLVPTPAGPQDGILQDLADKRAQLVAQGLDPDRPDLHDAFFKDEYRSCAEPRTTPQLLGGALAQAIGAWGSRISETRSTRLPGHLSRDHRDVPRDAPTAAKPCAFSLNPA